jgi:uncharacterized membrane protein (UPF0136 family)
MLMAIGVAAYFRKQSLVSLFMGTGCGFLIAISGLLLFFKKKIGIYSAISLTSILVITFGIRYSNNHQMVPAILCVFSGGMLLFLLAQSVTWKRS